MPCLAQSRRASRVSSAATSGTARRTSIARSVMSPMFPIGVATTYSVGPGGRSATLRRAWPSSRIEVVDAGRPRAEFCHRCGLALVLGRGDQVLDAIDARVVEAH